MCQKNKYCVSSHGRFSPTNCCHLLHKDLIYQIGLTLIPGVGSVTAKTLISYCGSIEAVFTIPKSKLLKIPGIGEKSAHSISNNADVLQRAENEAVFIEKQKITPLFFFDKGYPQRLKNCSDAPMMLYCKGNADLNKHRIISVVGTRKATDYGKDLCNKLIEGLAKYNLLVVSGLAYGIDHAAHQACLQKQVSTVGVLAHGLDRIYPPGHDKMAKAMLENGGLVTEFPSGTKPDRENFPRRNRIIAGLADATIVVETATKGGSMITAQIAGMYHRDVFAFPGRTTDKYSIGCNQLIKNNMAILLENAEDVAYHLAWENITAKPLQVQKQLFVELDPDEEKIVQTLQNANSDGMHIDLLGHTAQLSPGATATALLTLELKGLVRATAGSIFKLC